MTGQPLSVARATQLSRIRTPKGKRAVKRMPIPENLKRALRRVQRQWRKKHPTIDGTISTRGLRYQIETYGLEQAEMSLDKAYRYSIGLAYLENVLSLIERIENDLSKDYDPDMAQVLEMIKTRQLSFREEWLGQIYHVDVLYAWEKDRISGSECARRIRGIIL